MTFHGEGGEIDRLARGFESLDSALEVVRRSLRGLHLEDSGPREAASAFGDATRRLERGLSEIATEAQEAALVVRRYDEGARA